jgi:hypothetical protein
MDLIDFIKILLMYTCKSQVLRCICSLNQLPKIDEILLKTTKLIKGAQEILGYPMSTSSKSTSFGVGLRSLKVG